MGKEKSNSTGVCERKGRKGWWARILYNGREHWYPCANKTQALAVYRRMKAEIFEKRYFPEKYKRGAEAVTLRDWIRSYLEGCSNKGKTNEVRYGRRWSLLLGARLITEITTKDLKPLQAKFKAKGKWSDATINRHFAFLRRVLQCAVNLGKITTNPALKQKQEREGIIYFPEANSTRFLKDDELARLRGIMSPAHWSLVAFAIETGLRRAEQFGLRWNQVDLENGMLTIPLPKGGKTRHVPLSESAKAILQSLDSDVNGSPWVFPHPKDPLRPWNPDSFINHFYTPARKKAGITGACWHTLRHTAASRRVKAGVDLVSVKEILGHKDIKTTLRYSHIDSDHLKKAINRGSLNESVAKSVTKEKIPITAPDQEVSEVIDLQEKKGWLGDEDSNLGRQIQSLSSYH